MNMMLAPAQGNYIPCQGTQLALPVMQQHIMTAPAYQHQMNTMLAPAQGNYTPCTWGEQHTIPVMPQQQQPQKQLDQIAQLSDLNKFLVDDMHNQKDETAGLFSPGVQLEVILNEGLKKI